MMLKDIAEDIGMHLSTVSRVVNRKLRTHAGRRHRAATVLTEGMMNEDGEEVSTRIIKLKIKKIDRRRKILTTQLLTIRW